MSWISRPLENRGIGLEVLKDRGQGTSGPIAMRVTARGCLDGRAPAAVAARWCFKQFINEGGNAMGSEADDHHEQMEDARRYVDFLDDQDPLREQRQKDWQCKRAAVVLLYEAGMSLEAIRRAITAEMFFEDEF